MPAALRCLLRRRLSKNRSLLLGPASLELWPLCVEVTFGVEAFKAMASEDIPLQSCHLCGGDACRRHRLDVVEGREEHGDAAVGLLANVPNHSLVTTKVGLNLWRECYKQAREVWIFLKSFRHRLQKISLQDAPCSEGSNGGRQVDTKPFRLVQDSKTLEHLGIRGNDSEGGSPEQVLDIFVGVCRTGWRGKGRNPISVGQALVALHRHLSSQDGLSQRRNWASNSESFLNTPEASAFRADLVHGPLQKHFTIVLTTRTDRVLHLDHFHGNVQHVR
mmetsp:Transcript_107353/g.213112  ORF Transcript_107353/g.213112 Transcript_107353/m.213112 type:complete len:276 (-) Transcript_107353:767-1594(-)